MVVGGTGVVVVVVVVVEVVVLLAAVGCESATGVVGIGDGDDGKVLVGGEGVLDGAGVVVVVVVVVDVVVVVVVVVEVVVVVLVVGLAGEAESDATASWLFVVRLRGARDEMEGCDCRLLAVVTFVGANCAQLGLAKCKKITDVVASRSLAGMVDFIMFVYSCLSFLHECNR